MNENYFFPFKGGYICYDKAGIYVTQDGWPEVKSLKEKTSETLKQSDKKQLKNTIFVAFFAFLVVLLLYNGFWVFALVLGGLLFSAYFYLGLEKKLAFKIPIEKITELTEVENGIVLIFKNGDGELDSISINGLPEKHLSRLLEYQTGIKET